MAAQVAAAPSLDAQLRELWAVRDGFFASDPAAKAALVARRVSSLVAAAEACDASSAEARARSAFVRGRALDAGDAYDPAAEAALSRAVKLAPDDVAAWNALGHAFWKKGTPPAPATATRPRGGGLAPPRARAL
ncbi:chromatin binding protein [Aureococcus anophagefferens]|uniref:Chromatin binding protein n=1 Tax=Aureococcus anophagefferens TaxID=44056 RepID=A0ABR1FSG1_AURAN